MSDAHRPPLDEGSLLAKVARQVPGVLYQFQRFPDGRSCFPFASDGIATIYEVSPESVRSDASAVFARLHPDDLANVAASIEDSARTLEPWHAVFRVNLPSRGVRWLRGDARPERLDDDSVLWHGYIVDITDTEMAREALRESELRYRILVEQAPDAIVVYDAAQQRFTEANSRACELFGLSHDELLERDVLSVSAPIQPDGRPSTDAAPDLMARALNDEHPVFEWLHRNAAGEDVLCEVHLTALPYMGEVFLRGSLTDIRERKRLDDRLRQLDAAIRSSLSAIAIADLTGQLTYVNEAFLRLWGYGNAAEVLGRPATSFWANPAEALVVQQALHTGGSWTGELLARRADGEMRTLTLAASLFHDASGAPLGLLASFVDVTAERSLQTQLQQAQRLESVGRLAGGVAHDFNNLLTVMRGYLELSVTTLHADDPLAEHLREIEHAVDSAARLTQQLLAFSRRQIIAPRVLDLRDTVHGALGMLRRLLGEDITLRYLPADDVGLVRFDAGQAEQILVNLAVNARDAMPDGGHLTIELSNVTLDDAYVAQHPGVVTGDYVALSVSDTGTGMSRETREHAFEPFYTTKEAGRGTGLGLAMIHGAVSQNDGRIEVYSEPGHGARFTIYLPRVTASGEPSEPAGAVAAATGHETILLVEDDARVRTVAERLLTRAGYTVVPQPDGEVALAWLADTPLPVHLLLTDVVMPRMNGRVLAERAQQLRPGLRVLYTSGYTANVIVQHGVLKPGVDFLPKPYTGDALTRLVRTVLDRPATAAV